jgi:hypothetical protein
VEVATDTTSSEVAHLPRWVEANGKPTDGIDLLGLRLPVQRIGLSLLDGITTVTPSVRYLGLRAWLIHLYGRSGGPDTQTAFAEFSLRVEAGLVLGSLLESPSLNGMVGSDEATVLIASTDDKIDVKALVQTPAAVIYAGAANQIALTEERGKSVPAIVSNRASALVLAIDKQFAHCSALRELLDPGVMALARSDLKALGQVARIDAMSTEEKRLLAEALIPREAFERERARVGTYAALLFLAKQRGKPPLELDFLRTACSTTGFDDPHLSATADGWLVYCIRDAIAVSQEASFATVMGELLGNRAGAAGGTLRHELLTVLVEDPEAHETALRDISILAAGESIAGLTFRDVVNLIETRLGAGAVATNGIARWQSAFTEPQLYAAALKGGPGALSVAVVAWITAVLRVGRGRIGDTEIDGRLSFQGHYRMGMRGFLLPQFEVAWEHNKTFLTVAADFAQRTLQQHLMTAWSRMEGDLKTDVALFHAEGPTLFARGNSFSAGRTASRIPQALGWLQQLDLIDREGITPQGEKTLERAFDTLARPVR